MEKVKNNLSAEEVRIRREVVFELRDLPPAEIAEWFHDFYESFAKMKGWSTQEKTRVAFKDLPEKNKETMICTTSAVLQELAGRLALPLIQSRPK